MSTNTNNTKKELSYRKQVIGWLVSIISGIVLPIGFFCYASTTKTDIKGMENLLKGQAALNAKLFDVIEQNRTLIGQANTQILKADTQINNLQELVVSSKKLDSLGILQLGNLQRVVVGTQQTIQGINSQLQVNQKALDASMKQLSIVSQQQQVKFNSDYHVLRDTIAQLRSLYSGGINFYDVPYPRNEKTFLNHGKSINRAFNSILGNSYLAKDSIAYSKILSTIRLTQEIVYMIDHPKEFNDGHMIPIERQGYADKIKSRFNTLISETEDLRRYFKILPFHYE